MVRFVFVCDVRFVILLCLVIGDSEAIFSARRITIAPLTVMMGYGVIFYSILKRFPSEASGS